MALVNCLQSMVLQGHLLNVYPSFISSATPLLIRYIMVHLKVMCQQQQKMMIHHSLGPNPDHGVYRGMSEAVRVASTFLTDLSSAPEEIDVRTSLVSDCINGRESS